MARSTKKGETRGQRYTKLHDTIPISLFDIEQDGVNVALRIFLCNDLFLPFWCFEPSLHFEEMIFPLVSTIFLMYDNTAFSYYRHSDWHVCFRVDGDHGDD